MGTDINAMIRLPLPSHTHAAWTRTRLYNQCTAIQAATPAIQRAAAYGCTRWFLQLHASEFPSTGNRRFHELHNQLYDMLEVRPEDNAEAAAEALAVLDAATSRRCDNTLLVLSSEGAENVIPSHWYELRSTFTIHVLYACEGACWRWEGYCGTYNADSEAVACWAYEDQALSEDIPVDRAPFQLPDDATWQDVETRFPATHRVASTWPVGLTLVPFEEDYERLVLALLARGRVTLPKQLLDGNRFGATHSWRCDEHVVPVPGEDYAFQPTINTPWFSFRWYPYYLLHDDLTITENGRAVSGQALIIIRDGNNTRLYMYVDLAYTSSCSSCDGGTTFQRRRLLYARSMKGLLVHVMDYSERQALLESVATGPVASADSLMDGSSEEKGDDDGCLSDAASYQCHDEDEEDCNETESRQVLGAWRVLGEWKLC